MSNENCLEGISCPECGSEGPFLIEVSRLVVVYDDGIDFYDKRCSGAEWGYNSYIKCFDCKHSGELKLFSAEQPCHDS